MTTQCNKLREDVHFRILRLLQDNPEMSQRELAKAVGLSTGGIHYVLNALIERGFVKLGNFTASEDKRRYAYVLTPKGIAQKAALPDPGDGRVYGASGRDRGAHLRD